MEVKKFNQINEEITRKEMDDMDVTERDLVGGISTEEYDKIISFVQDLQRKENIKEITDEEKVLSEVLLQLINHPFDRSLDFEIGYHRRLGFVKGNKDKKIED